jgi:hypothetical protein
MASKEGDRRSNRTSKKKLAEGKSKSACSEKETVETDQKTPFTIKLKCKHRDCGNLKKGLELVPDISRSLPYKDQCTIIYSGDDPEPPESISISKIGEVSGSGNYNVDFEINPNEFFLSKSGSIFNSNQNYLVKGGAFAGLSFYDSLRRMWTYHSKITHHVSGLPIDFPITIYNPEKWKITVSLPPAKKYSVGEVLSKDENKKYKQVELTSSEESWNPKTGIQDKVEENHLEKKEPKKTSEKKKIEAIQIEREGAAVQFDGISAITSLVSFFRMMNDLMEGITDNVPQIGWFIDFELQFMQGDLSLEYCWKEWKDERAYYYVALSAKMKLIYLKLEFGFGIKTGFATAQLFANGTAELPLNLNNKHHAPGYALNIEFSIAYELALTVGARVEVAYIVKCEATLKSGINITGAFTINSESETPMSIKAEKIFTGIKGTLTWSFFGGGGAGHTKSSSNSPSSFSSGGKEEKEIMKERLLKRYEWPSAGIIKDIFDSEVTEDEFKQIITRKALDYVLFDDDCKLMNGNVKEMDELREKIADDICQKMFSEPILKTVKGVEGIASQILVKLKKLEKKSRFSFDVVEYNQLNDFLNNVIPVIASQCINPISSII